MVQEPEWLDKNGRGFRCGWIYWTNPPWTMKSVDPTFQVDLDCIGELSECTKPNCNFNFYVDFKISIMASPHLSQVISPAFALVEELVPGSKPWICWTTPGPKRWSPTWSATAMSSAPAGRPKIKARNCCRSWEIGGLHPLQLGKKKPQPDFFVEFWRILQDSEGFWRGGST